MPVMSARYVSERFVGRERELSRLAVSLEAAAGGRTGRIVLSGPGGVGVSRLVDETIRRVERLSSPFTVIRCEAVPGSSAVPYAPISAGFREFLAELDDAELQRVVGPATEPMSRLVPELADRVAQPATLRRRSIDPERRAVWFNEAIRGVLERAGERRPVLIVIEDLQYADGATRGLATFLARVARPARFCLVATYAVDALSREHPLHADLEAMASSSNPPERMVVEPMSGDELVQLLANIDGERPTAATVLLISARSAGNPLVVEEIAAARRELSGVRLDASFDELIAARMARRSPECRRFLRLLAPAWQPLDQVEIAAVAAAFERLVESLPPRSSARPRRLVGDLDPHLEAGRDEAIEFGFVVRLRDGRLAIRHEFVARAIENDLLPHQWRRHHEAVAEALGAESAAALPHWRAANRPEAARAAAIAAAAHAEDLDSPIDALSAREVALQLGAGDGADPITSGEFLARTGEVALAAGRPDRALAYLESAAGRFGEREDRDVAASLHEALGRVARTLGDHDRALAEHRRAAASVSQDHPSLRARILASLAQTLMLHGHFAEAATTARTAINASRQAGADALATEGHATCTLGIALAWSADPGDAIGLLEHARDIARETGHADDAFRATLNLATALTLLGRREDAIEVTRRAVNEARTDGLEVAYGNALRGNIAEALFLVGRWDEARDIIRTALEWSPAPEAFADASVTAAMLEVETSVDERAASLLGWRPLRMERSPDPQLEVPATRAAASFALWRGDIDDARRAAELGWSLVTRAEDWALTARMASTYLEVQDLGGATASSTGRVGDRGRPAGKRPATRRGEPPRSRSAHGHGPGVRGPDRGPR
jgi:tetratricopeptide (TPR) repeat protein/Cdc6-like AAA superfamily ATPase